MVLITEVEDRRIVKPFLGGYRNKLTNIEYLNAASQTGPAPKEWENLRSRAVQCVELKEAASQHLRDGSTQMWRKDYYVPNSSDTNVIAKPYESHEEQQKRLDVEGNARIIQRAYRAYRVLKAIRDYSRGYKLKVEICHQLEVESAEKLRKRYQDELRRQTYPQSRTDFDKLFSLIETWRVSRLSRIKNRMFAASRLSEDYRVLEEMTEMLRVIDKHRQCVASEHRKRKRVRFLTINSKPVRWNAYKAKPVEMITLRNQRARRYKTIYDDLSKKPTSTEERIELLSLLRNSLKNSHSCTPAENFVRLMDQELELLSSGINGSWLEYLRERISIAYLSFIKQVESCTCVYPEPSLFSHPEDLSEPLERKKLLCRSCLRSFPPNRFSVHVRMKKLSCCMSCSWLGQQNIDKRHYGPYTFLLNGIRAQERRRNCYSSLLYVIREPGIYHLVNNVWHARSIVSENGDLFNLLLVRFNVHEEWSPWNCILLTSQEAETHFYVKNFESFYSKHLLHKIYLAHQIAKTHFKELISFERKFRLSSRYYMIQDRMDYEPLKSTP